MKLGERARDLVSGFTGRLTARIEHLGGHVEWKITALVADDLTVKSEWFHEGCVELVADPPRMGIV